MSLDFSIIAGFYFTGDGALRDKDGDYRITGRMDDVINVSGKRLGTAEIEDAMVTNKGSMMIYGVLRSHKTLFLLFDRTLK